MKRNKAPQKKTSLSPAHSTQQKIVTGDKFHYLKAPCHYFKRKMQMYLYFECELVSKIRLYQKALPT